jgi:hypothetical protein
MITDFFCLATPLTPIQFVRSQCVLLSGSGVYTFLQRHERGDTQVASRDRLPRGFGPAYLTIVAVLRWMRGVRRSSRAWAERD